MNNDPVDLDYESIDNEERYRSAGLTNGEQASKKKPAPVVALRIPAADLALARKQAERKGLPLIEREEHKAG